MTLLGRLLGGLLGSALKFLAFFGMGVGYAKRKAAEKSAEIKDAQLEEAANRPRNRAELVERLRSGGGL